MKPPGRWGAVNCRIQGTGGGGEGAGGHERSMAASQPVKSAEQAAQISGRAASLMSPGPDCARSSSLTSLRHSPAALGNPTGALNLTALRARHCAATCAQCQKKILADALRTALTRL
jgi:hypothetical protein